MVGPVVAVHALLAMGDVVQHAPQAGADVAAAVVAAKARARTELTASITDIAVGAAEAVVQKPIDRAAQTALVEDYVNRSGSQN